MVWTGSLTPKGYGELNVGGRCRRAHRVTWESANGGIPNGALLLHSCDTPACVNPDHLRLGTAAENTADMLARNRAKRGDQCSWTIVPDELVPMIRTRVASGPRGTMSQVARELGVSVSTIQDIVTHRKRAMPPASR